MSPGTPIFSSSRLHVVLLVTLLIFVAAGAAFASTSSPAASAGSDAVNDTGCEEAIVNGGFEERTGWVNPGTNYTAGYAEDPEPVRTGDYSMRTGIVNPAHERYSYSSAIQAFYLPADAEQVTLSFWIFPQTEEDESIPIRMPKDPLGIREEDAANVSDWQFVFLLDKYGNELERLLYRRQDVTEWQYHSFDITDWKNRTVQIYFDTFNNGYNGVTSMHIDDVSVQICSEVQPPDPDGAISGSVVLVGRTDHSGAVVCADDGSAPPICVQTGATGTYDITVPPGNYTVTVAMPRYLDAEKLNVPVSSGLATLLDPVSLLGGDCNDDCTIDILDLSLVGGHFGLSCGDTGWDARADINDDCVVNILDLSATGSNFGESCPVPWS